MLPTDLKIFMKINTYLFRQEWIIRFTAIFIALPSAFSSGNIWRYCLLGVTTDIR